MHIYFYVFFWYISSISISVFYRIVGKFHVSGFLTSCSLITQSLIASIYTRKFPQLHFNSLLSIFSLGMYIILSNVSLQYIPIRVSVMFKCLVPIMSLIVAKLSNLETPDYHTVVNLIYLTLGIVLSNIKEDYTVTSIVGYTLAIITCIFSGLKFTALKIYLMDNPAIGVLRDTGVYMGIMTLPIGIYQIYNVVFNFNVEYIFLSIFIGSFLGYFIAIFEYSVIKQISVWEIILFDTLKEIILIIGSSFFEEQLTFVNWMGVFIVLVTVISLKYKVYLEELVYLN